MIEKINANLPTVDKISLLNDMIMEINGKNAQGMFDINYRLVNNNKHKLDCNCMACRMIRGETKGKNNPSYVNGNSIKEHFCPCGNKITCLAIMCRECKNKEQSKRMIGIKNIHILGINHPFYGKKRYEHSKIMKGTGNPNYIDGRTSLTQLIRNLNEYKTWRTEVFKRDNYRCQECGDNRGGNLEAHHLKLFSLLLTEFLKLYSQFSPIEDKETLVRLAISYKDFWDINNGETFCKKCHDKKLKKVRVL